MNDRYSKLAFLHRVKERKTPSLSAQASFAPFSLKVAWSGKSLVLAAWGLKKNNVHNYMAGIISLASYLFYMEPPSAGQETAG